AAPAPSRGGEPLMRIMGNLRIKPILTAKPGTVGAPETGGLEPLPSLDELIEVAFSCAGTDRKGCLSCVLTERGDGRILLSDGIRAGARTAMFMGLAGLPRRVRRTAMDEVRAILEKHGTADFLLNWRKPEEDLFAPDAASVSLLLLYKNGRSVSAPSAGKAGDELKALFRSLARRKGLWSIFSKK
ncbi:MAG: hypothetical protein II724_05875, partial [Clostridia bacterium]|nr:hypothetical protein [Clostridia bacterium]